MMKDKFDSSSSDMKKLKTIQENQIKVIKDLTEQNSQIQTALGLIQERNEAQKKIQKDLRQVEQTQREIQKAVQKNYAELKHEISLLPPAPVTSAIQFSKYSKDAEKLQDSQEI